MAERIYILDGNNLEPMEEQRFALEDDLQELIAKRPDLIDGEQVSPGNPRRWLLVKREMGVPAVAGGTAWWGLDHLLLDQDAVPTLVEVKRGKNAQIHYEIVGQMMNYAAHGSAFWTEDALRRSFSETWGDCANDHLAKFLGPNSDEGLEASSFWNHEENRPDDDAFWIQAATNLAARRLRLLFVADSIPDSLALIVEFLNAHLRDNIEALAVEVKQFKGEAEERSALVPHVIGRTAAALGGTGGARIRSKISLDEFMSLLPSDAVRDATQQLLDVAQDCGAKIELGDKGVTIRTQLPDGGPPSRITVAWLYPPGGPFWMGLKNYAFGESVTGWAKLSAKRKEALDAWVGQFEGDGDAFGGQWSGSVRACVVDHENVATHIDTLTDRLAKVIGDLQAS